MKKRRDDGSSFFYIFAIDNIVTKTGFVIFGIIAKKPVAKTGFFYSNIFFNKKSFKH